MDDLSLYLLDLVQNSIAARASAIELSIIEDNMLHISIIDNGVGMDSKTLEQVTSPFYTTRKTRKVGLGLSLIKMLAEQTDGMFSIQSELNQGTILQLSFNHHHLDMPPFGNLGEMAYMISIHQDVNNFTFTYEKNGEHYIYSLSEMKSLLGESIFEHSMMLALIELINQEIEKIRGN
jgi:hypothetical protein